MAEDQKTTSQVKPQGAPRTGGRNDRGERRPRRNDRREAPKEEKMYEENVIAIDRVARVVKGGRRFRFKALVVVGDRKNKVGVGVAKGADVQVAVQKATDVAKKSLITIPIVNTTIPHDIEARGAGYRYYRWWRGAFGCERDGYYEPHEQITWFSEQGKHRLCDD